MADFKLAQTKTRSLLGAGIWLEDVYPTITWANNYLCGHMANPSPDAYKHAKHWLMHLNQHRFTVIFGGDDVYNSNRSLRVGQDPIHPFTPLRKELGFEWFSDANLGTNGNFKATSAGVGMLGGSLIILLCQRQQLVAPDSHTAEVNAAGTGLHHIIPMRGLLQELRLQPLRPTPFYIDSVSTLFVATDAGAVKRSVWLRRRAKVLLEGVELGVIQPIKIHESNNCADDYTKGVSRETFYRHMRYTHNMPNSSPADVAQAAGTVVSILTLADMRTWYDFICTTPEKLGPEAASISQHM